MNKLCYKDLKSLSEKDRWYSMAISPITSGAVSAVILYFLIGFSPLQAMVTGAITMLVWLVHITLGWSDYSSNWKYYYLVKLGDNTYHIVKDGARRVRVIKDDENVLSDVRTNQVYMNGDLEDWIRTDTPSLGVIDDDSASISL